MTSYEGPIRRVEGRTRTGKPTHWYEDHRSQKIDGVTTIMENGIPKPFLIGWAASAVAEYAVNNREQWTAALSGEMDETAYQEARKAVLDELRNEPRRSKDAAAGRGTEVHALAEQLVNGDEIVVPPLLAAHVNNYVEFLDTFQPEPVLSEVVVYNCEYGYAGTLDLIADMGGERWLIDLKTSKKVYSDVAYQLAAYRYATHYVDADGKEQPMIPVDRCAVVHVTAKSWAVVPIQADEAVLKAFRHISVVAAEMKTKDAYLGQPLNVLEFSA